MEIERITNALKKKCSLTSTFAFIKTAQWKFENGKGLDFYLDVF